MIIKFVTVRLFLLYGGGLLSKFLISSHLNNAQTPLWNFIQIGQKRFGEIIKIEHFKQNPRHREKDKGHETGLILL